MRLILSFLMAMLVAPAWAEWVKWSEDTSYATYYYDPATIEKNGHSARVWMIQDLKKPERLGDLSRHFLDEYDCNEARYRYLSVTAYSDQMARGRALLSREALSEWQYIAPQTFEARLLAILCK